MARLPNLPTELIRLIIRHASPYDIESLTLSCISIFNVGYKDLSRHRALKQNPIVLSCDGTIGSSPRHEATKIFMRMLETPLEAFYVRKISLNDEWLHWPDYADLNTALPEDLQVPYSEGTISRVKEAVSGIVPQDEFTDWLRHVQSGIEVPSRALLLPPLLLPPNLSTLELTFRFMSHNHAYTTLYRIVKMKGPGAPLSRLRHAKINSYFKPMDFRFITLFAALPSIISIWGGGIHTSGTDVDPTTEVAPRSSSLRELALVESSINPKILLDFLESFKALRSFTYSRPWSEIDRLRSSDPSAGSNFELCNIVSKAECKDYMGDLRCFESIRFLRTQIQLLLRGPVFFCASACLARALPSTLETLELICPGAYEESGLAKMLLGLAEVKTKYVPALKKVTVIVYYFIDDLYSEKPDYNYMTVAKACSNQGIELLLT